MHPTWFNGAHHRWRKTSGEHSFTASDMLKRFPSSKVYRVPSSAIELPQRSCQFVSVAGRGCSSHGTELSGLVVIGVALPLGFATSCSWLHWVGTYWCTNCPIRLDDSVLRKSGAVGKNTRNSDVAKDMGYIDPVRNGDAVETTGTMTTLTDGKDTIKCRDILS